MTIANQNRQLIVISGEQSECLSYAQQLTNKLEALFLKDQKRAQTFLGQEFDAVIFDCHQDFDPNAFGAITGTIRGGGFLVLLKPVVITQDINHDSLFRERFWSVVSKTEHSSLDASTEPTIELAPPQTASYETQDQNKAVERIIHVVKGHRRRPLVITADRGRGKSASLGIAAAKIFDEGYKNIIVCAPSKKTAEVIFKHALADSPKSNLSFYSPDELNQTKPKADLVLIDEAAAIPVSLLSDFLKHYSRIVFSTTQHGYEGSGRGFSVNFKKILDKESPEWVNCELNTPIRWGENDTIESFVFEALLLNAEPADLIKSSNVVDLDQCVVKTLDKKELISNDVVSSKPSMLTEVFGLLVSAHYQTKPSDLMHMLDDDLLSIHAIQFEQKTIAVALLIKEGGIEAKIATDIYEGTRRLQGHLVAQSLAANVGIENAPCLSGERIVRIAVHSGFQQQGYGSALLNSLIQNSKADYLSTSFGASTELLRFWKHLKFTPVYLGMKRDASSGAHSVIMLLDKTEKGKDLIQDARQRFTRQFPYSLSEIFSEIEYELALSLFTSQKRQDIDKRELQAFVEKQRGYENSLYAIWHLVCSELSNKSALDNSEKKILVLKVLQKHSWKKVKEKMGDELQGKKDAVKLVRKALGKLFS